MTDKELLVHLAKVARTKYKLTVWQWLPGHVGSHAPGSLHGLTFPGSHVGRAFDAYGSRWRMARFARHCKKVHGERLTEGIFNYGRLGSRWNLSIKHGHHVSPAYWGPVTWTNHKNHVHVGI